MPATAFPHLTILGSEVKRLRREAGVLQKVAAEDLGTSPVHLWRIETGKGQPSAALARKIVDYYGVTLDDITERVEQAS